MERILKVVRVEYQPNKSAGVYAPCSKQASVRGACLRTRHIVTEFVLLRMDHIKDPTESRVFYMVRVERIELSSLAWKAGILATIRHPRQGYIIPD